MSDLNRSRENGLKGKFKGLLDYFMGADLPNDERPGGSRFTGMPQLTGEATPLNVMQGAHNIFMRDSTFYVAQNIEFHEQGRADILERPKDHFAPAIHPSVLNKVPSSSVHYRVYNDEGAIVPKRPAYLTDSCLDRVRPKWVAPPHNAGSLRRCLALMPESIDPTDTTLFATLSNKSALADDIPVSFETNQTLGIAPDDPVALFTKASPGDGLWPGKENLRVPPDGSTSNGHVMFKFTTQLSLPTFSEGSHYKILSSTGKAWSLLSGIDPGRDLYLYDLFGHQVYRNSPTISFSLKLQNDGGIALRCAYSGKWAGPNFCAYPTEYSYYFVPTECEEWFYICPDKTFRQGFYATQVRLNGWDFQLGVKDLNANDLLQRWRVVPARP